LFTLLIIVGEMLLMASPNLLASVIISFLQLLTFDNTHGFTFLKNGTSVHFVLKCFNVGFQIRTEN